MASSKAKSKAKFKPFTDRRRSSRITPPSRRHALLPRPAPSASRARAASKGAGPAWASGARSCAWGGPGQRRQ
eukprot:590105-Pyramimonas_sp.AAC.1